MAPIGGSYPSGYALPAYDGKHAPAVCKRIGVSADFHGKSWSHRYECPECGDSQRRNSNFLGSRYRLVCDGQRIVRTHRDECPKPRPEHVCGLQGFGALGDLCPACEAREAARQVAPSPTEGGPQ